MRILKRRSRSTSRGIDAAPAEASAALFLTPMLLPLPTVPGVQARFLHRYWFSVATDEFDRSGGSIRL
jgi:hypothetical protein